MQSRGGLDEVICGRRPRKRQQQAPKPEPIKIDKAVITGRYRFRKNIGGKNWEACYGNHQKADDA